MNDDREPVDGPEARLFALFDAYYGLIIAFGMRRGLDRSDAEDLAADVFLTAWRRLETAPAEALPWLYAIAQRILGNQRRASGRRRCLADRLAGTHRDTRADLDETVVGSDAVGSVLARLSATDRDILRLVAWEGLDHAGAGLVLRCSATAARLRWHRARRHFVQMMTAIEKAVEPNDGLSELRAMLPEEIA